MFTHLAVAFFKEGTSEDPARLLHCYQFDNVVTARSRYLCIQKKLIFNVLYNVSILYQCTAAIHILYCMYQYT